MSRTALPAGPCPSEEVLFAHVSGSGRVRDPERLLAHLDACDACRRLVAEASRVFTTSPGDPFVVAKIRTFSDGDLLLDRYKIEKFLAQGGMGEVYVARDLLLEESVALKTLACTVLDDPRAAFRFKAEARLARRVTHPNVCRILEYGLHVRKRNAGSTDSIPFLTMELLPGETLARRLASRGRMTEHQALPMLQQIIGGLRAIHGCGIVHRDLKSENVFLVPDLHAGERAVVMDFGLARAVDGSVVSTWPMARVLAGTVDTMAPEQIEGRPPEPTMDVFAFGVLLFEVLTGRRPFRDVPPVKRLREKAPLPSSVVPDLHPRWDRIVGRCLELDPRERYPSLSELGAALLKAERPVAGPAVG